ncbi:synergin gamma isoform X2 [Eurytemora carolleeae]|uniref:synergin gamma isoform X2 n=1 Tax=Eurytemora carolleeae TaxID=1294199 RepID=UPI000C7921EC|nr:synergin gamma isoform X2 [Eurytemora carolleeae]|eukprot:XP_023333964.1 synergin gamma-like isoform X2 [Eurytemora affinis]
MFSPPGFSSSPPSTTLEFQLPSEQFQLTDQELFGTCVVNKKNKKVGSDKLKPSISNGAVETETDIEKESHRSKEKDDIYLTPGLRPSSQSSVSVASLDLENKLEVGEEDKEEDVEDKVEDEECFVVDWIACLQEIDNLIETTSQIFSNILNPDIVDEVVNCEGGKKFLNNLREVFIVFSRIQQAAKKREETDQKLDELINKVSAAWNYLKKQTNNAEILEMSDDLFNLNSGLGHSSACGVCLTSLSTFGGKNGQNGGSKNINTAHFSCGDIEYHATCANFWINLVDPELPRLK